MGGRVRQLGSDGTRALGIDKGKQLHVFDLLDQIKRCLEILFRLAGETYNHIRRNRRMLEHLTQQAAFLRVFRRGILPIHAL